MDYQEICQKYGLEALNSVNLRYANLRDADLRYADLRCADLRGADLRYADLRCADLRYADLSNANLRDANLRDANLSNANLSQSQGLPKASRILDLLERTSEGLIVYKTFGDFRPSPESWEGQEVIEEVANLLPTDECGCGVNVATFDWVVNNTSGQIWQCLIKWEDLAESVVPYSSDGKFRCSRLTKIKPVDRP